MLFVLRDSDGSILSVHRDPVPGAQVLEKNHPEVLAFLSQGQGVEKQSFAGLDADLVRVLEDLIDVLIERNILRVTDLPAEAQQKLFDRKTFRNRMVHSLRLFGSEQDGLVGGHEVVASDLMDLPPMPGTER